MSSASRLLVTLGLFIALVAGLGLLSPAWLVELGLDWSTLADLHQQLVEAEARSAELESQERILLERLHAKERITQEVLAGRQTLLQAAAWFRYLTESEPTPGQAIWLYPGAKWEEKYCRQVILWVRYQETQDPNSPEKGLAERLERELQEKLAHPGSLQLPEVLP